MGPVFGGFTEPWQRITLALALGALGGFAAQSVGMPLPWMLGPMIFCTIGCIFGLPLKGPMPIRPPMMVILGLMLGSSFTPELLGRAGEFAISLITMFVFLILAACCVYPFLRRVGGYDPITAYFAAMPGGVNDMVIIGGEMGGDERRIALTQASRILLTVLTVPLLMQVFSDYEGRSGTGPWTAFSDISFLDYTLFAVCGLVGWQIGKRARFPAPLLTGPMLASAIIHGGGWMEAQPPTLLVNMAQWVLGTVIGCRFVGVARSEIFFVLKISVVSTAILLGLAAVFAIGLAETFGFDFRGLILAYAPGGMAEMGLVALALGIDTAFVASHHVIRIMIVIGIAPIIFGVWNKGPAEKPPD